MFIKICIITIKNVTVVVGTLIRYLLPKQWLSSTLVTISLSWPGTKAVEENLKQNINIKTTID